MEVGFTEFASWHGTIQIVHVRFQRTLKCLRQKPLAELLILDDTIKDFLKWGPVFVSFNGNIYYMLMFSVLAMRV